MKVRMTVPSFRTAKRDGSKIKVVTAYDYTSARLVDRSGVDAILVGDSLGMVMLGYAGTTQVTMSEMLHHIRPVVKGAPGTFVIADMPFGSYQVGPEQAITNAIELMKAGADCIKLEGGVAFATTVRRLVQMGIPVMGHIGLTPQTAAALGGWKVQGRDFESAQRIIEDALALEAAGAFSIVLEMVPAALAAYISERLTIPTIGIGAGSECDGQVLVWHDMFGLYDGIAPRFVKRFAEAGNQISEGLNAYCSEVDSGTFPAPEHSFKMKPEELHKAIGERILV